MGRPSLAPDSHPPLLRQKPFALFRGARVATALTSLMQAVAVG